MVQSVTGGTGTLLKRIQAESANPGGDIFWSGGFGTLSAFQGVMEPYVSPEAKAIDPKFVGPNNTYIGTNVHVMVLMVNERQLKGLAQLCQDPRVRRAYVVTRALDDFGPLALPAVPEAKILRVPAPLLCYWMGQSETRPD